MNLRRRLVLIQVGAFLVPLAVVAILVTGPLPGPVRVNAAPMKPGGGRVSPADPRIDQARQWLDHLPSDQASPFEMVVHAAPTPERPPEVPPPAVDGFRLGGVFASSRDAVAAINGRLYRAGDQIAPGATLLSIDARARKATIRLADGRTLDLTTDNHARPDQGP